MLYINRMQLKTQTYHTNPKQIERLKVFPSVIAKVVIETGICLSCALTVDWKTGRSRGKGIHIEKSAYQQHKSQHRDLLDECSTFT